MCQVIDLKERLRVCIHPRPPAIVQVNGASRFRNDSGTLRAYGCVVPGALVTKCAGSSRRGGDRRRLMCRRRPRMPRADAVGHHGETALPEGFGRARQAARQAAGQAARHAVRQARQWEGKGETHVHSSDAGAARGASRNPGADRDACHGAGGATRRPGRRRDHRGRYGVRPVAGRRLGSIQELHAVLHQLGPR